MSVRKGLRAWILAGVVSLAVAGGLAGTQAGHSAVRGVTTHHVFAGGAPIWPPVEVAVPTTG
jgi:hypothetical protein